VLVFATVAVSPLPAGNPPLPATRFGHVDLRAGSPVEAGTYRFDAIDVVTEWHHHDLDELLYAIEGTVETETAAGRYVLSPQQAAWIPAMLEHRTTLRNVRSIAVLFTPAMTAPATTVRVLAVAPVVREMILHSIRWPISRPFSDATADRFFPALAALCVDWSDVDPPLILPVSRDPVIQLVMAHTDAHLGTVVANDVCSAARISERSLRRKFREDTGITWEQYRLQSRIVRAVTLLADPRNTVLATAHSVGFASVNAFTRAFRRCTGETPRDYRIRAKIVPR
jgi:AraC-like DNA-binding protein